jgi:hypothetical protein
MGKLFVMPTPVEAEDKEQAREGIAPEMVNEAENTIDLTVWKSAPRERTADYFPVYSQVSRAMQATMRGWVRSWFREHPEMLQRPHAAYSYLVYICTHPFYGKSTSTFTYDVQQTEMLRRAYASAGVRLKAEMEQLNTQGFCRFTRQHYFAYRSKHVVEYVSKNQRAIFRMFNTETGLMDAILKFTQIDLPNMKFEEAVAELRRAFRNNLRRFSKDIDLSERAEDLLRVATQVLLTDEPDQEQVRLAA